MMGISGGIFLRIRLILLKFYIIMIIFTHKLLRWGRQLSTLLGCFSIIELFNASPTFRIILLILEGK
jgi:hypothetical protein